MAAEAPTSWKPSSETCPVLAIEMSAWEQILFLGELSLAPNERKTGWADPDREQERGQRQKNKL